MQKSNNRGIDYPKVSQYIRIIRDENKENTINDYSKKIDILIDEEKQTYEELENNKRARSAKLRIIKRIK